MDLEHLKKDAKALVRAFRAGEPEAAARAEAHLGGRARERFLLSDAQHVVARELGYRTWPELKRTLEGRHDELVDTGLEYAPGDPVRVHVVRRGRRVLVTDDGAAVARAGRPPGWREAAERVAVALIVNVSRSGVLSLPVPARRFTTEEIVERTGAASLALYQEILDLEG